jgi:hypothetical protein
MKAHLKHYPPPPTGTFLVPWFFLSIGRSYWFDSF